MNGMRVFVYGLVIALGVVLAIKADPGALAEEARAPAATQPARAVEPGEFERGFVFGLFRKDAAYFLTREYEGELNELVELRANAVTIIARQFMKTGKSTTIYAHREETVADDRLRAVIQAARERKLQVTLFPYVLIENPAEDEWRGNIEPESWKEWFVSYRQMIEHYALIARDEDVATLCIGSELVSSEPHEKEWRAVIARVRQLYEGKIFYSANWDHYQEIAFLDATDFAAVNGYHRLSDSPTTDVAALAKTWSKIKKEVLDWRARVGKPLLLTEIGYASVVGTSVDPWDYTLKGNVALEEQAACLEAFTRVWRHEPTLSGVHFYLWWGEGGEKDIGYTPRGKPAAAVIRRFFADHEQR